MRWPWSKNKGEVSEEKYPEVKPRNQILQTPEDATSKSKEKLSPQEAFRKDLQDKAKKNEGSSNYNLQNKAKKNEDSSDYKEEQQRDLHKENLQNQNKSKNEVKSKNEDLEL